MLSHLRGAYMKWLYSKVVRTSKRGRFTTIAEQMEVSPLLGLYRASLVAYEELILLRQV